MKSLAALILMIGAVFANAQSAPPSGAEQTSAERSVAEAQKLIGEKPAEYSGYNLLATALLRRARETADSTYSIQAEAAVSRSLQLSPNNFETEKIRASVLLAEHDYEAALALATALNKKTPDDVMLYGVLADADAALGKYKDAEIAAQWMLDLRPGNLPALLHAASLREVFGENDGAYELLDLALQSTPPTDHEQRGWILTQMAHIRLISGNTDAAEKLSQQALTEVPDYPYALSNLAQVRISQKRYEEAVALFQKRDKSSPDASNLYELAEAEKSAGKTSDSKKNFAEFERQALLESSNKNNANLQLIFYFADYTHDRAKALQFAEHERARRQDVYTLDADAWALHVNGNDAEARKQIETALAVGIRDAKFFRHAGEIALATGDRAAAQKYLRKAVDLNTSDSERARATLARLFPAMAQQ
jgi:tetratricopeptide (TPR) repeat protein